MTRRLLEKFIFLIILLLFVPLDLFAGEPTEQIKTAVDRLTAILSDKSLRPSTMKDKRDRMIMEVIDGIFNWEEFSRRALGTYWGARTEEEKKEFISLLRQMIVNTYIDYAPRYSNEKLLLLNEKTEKDYGILNGEVITSKERHIPIELRLIKKSGIFA